MDDATNRKLSGSERETEKIAAKLAATLSPGDVVALFGGMGMGKTAFVRGLAAGLGLCSDDVCSPTFALVNEYTHPGMKSLYHFDFYRVEDEHSLLSTGFYEYLESGGILACEWSERIAGLLPPGTINVRISLGMDEGHRVIETWRAGG